MKRRLFGSVFRRKRFLKDRDVHHPRYEYVLVSSPTAKHGESVEVVRVFSFVIIIFQSDIKKRKNLIGWLIKVYLEQLYLE